MELAKYIGRSYEECNCFDLVKEFYLDHYGISIKNYFEGEVPSDRKTIESLIISGSGEFVKTPRPMYGDIVVIKLYGYSCHIGVYVGNGLFIHSVRNTGSCMEPVSKYSKVIDGYFRHQETSHHD